MRENRRSFLRKGAGLCLASILPLESGSAVFGAEQSKKRLKLVSVNIEAGSEKPFKALHISDTHLCFADERENARKKKLAADRLRHFGNGEIFFDAACTYAEKNEELLLHTGDLIDFVSASNLEAVQSKFKGRNCFVSSGNHEFSQYVGEAKEDAAYKAQSFDRVQKAYPNDLTFCSRIVKGINFIAFDDVYYNVTPEIHTRFKAEVEKGLPIVALCHCPLYTDKLFDASMSRPGSKSAAVVGAPIERMTGYEASRREQQKADEPTRDFLAWLKEQSLLKAILCGHLHFNWSGPFSRSAVQYVVSTNSSGAANEITFC